MDSPRTSFWTTVSPHDALSAPLAAALIFAFKLLLFSIIFEDLPQNTF